MNSRRGTSGRVLVLGNSGVSGRHLSSASTVDDGPSEAQREARARWMAEIERRKAAERERTAQRRILRLRGRA